MTGHRSDGTEDLPDGRRDSRGRGEKEGTAKEGKKGKKRKCRLKIIQMDGKDGKMSYFAILIPDCREDRKRNKAKK